MKNVLTFVLLLFHATVFSQIITRTNSVTYKLPANSQFKYLRYSTGTTVKVVYNDKNMEYFVCGEKVFPRKKLSNDERILPGICDCSEKGLIMIGATLSMNISSEEAESLVKNTDFRNVKLDGNSISLNTGAGEETLTTEQNDRLMAYATNYIQSYSNYIERSTVVAAAAARYPHIYFENSSSTLRSDSYYNLDLIISQLKASDKSVTINGHTSSNEKETVAEMDKLAKDRASAIKAYLINSGIPINRIKTQGYGETNPIASNKTEEGRMMNRRVELKIE